MKGAVQLVRASLQSPFMIVFCVYNSLHPFLAYCCFACYTLMSIKLPKPVRTLNRAFAPDLSKSISWSLFMEHAARALTCEISNPLDRAEVDISHSGRGLSRPQVDFVHCCGLSKLEGMLNIHTQYPNNRPNQSWTQKQYVLQDLKQFWRTLYVDFRGFNPLLIICLITEM